MSYTASVTNRTASSYFNVSDWTRIYHNSQIVNELSVIKLGTSITFTSVTAPSMSSLMTSMQYNIYYLARNVENIRAAMAALLPSLRAVKFTYAVGYNSPSPIYSDVNQWESTLDTVWNYWNDGTIPENVTLTEDLTIPTGTHYLVIGYINPDAYEIIIEGTGELHVL